MATQPTETNVRNEHIQFSSDTYPPSSTPRADSLLMTKKHKNKRKRPEISPKSSECSSEVELSRTNGGTTTTVTDYLKKKKKKDSKDSRYQKKQKNLRDQMADLVGLTGKSKAEVLNGACAEITGLRDQGLRDEILKWELKHKIDELEKKNAILESQNAELQHAKQKHEEAEKKIADLYDIISKLLRVHYEMI